MSDKTGKRPDYCISWLIYMFTAVYTSSTIFSILKL
jgi:hypothetical protein